MNRDEVARVVREVSYDLVRTGEAEPWDGFIVNPMAVYRRLREGYPGVARHIQRYYPSDPYQQIKVWVPRRLA
ncbi:MAG: hypothetical protein H6674_10985 [Dehalococcoidia bacterium]|nr:hypothetical protein [Dehalococcoidia bacterium]